MAAWRVLELFNIRPAMSISHVSIILNRFRVLKNMSDTYLLQCNADDDEVAHVLGDCVIAGSRTNHRRAFAVRREEGAAAIYPAGWVTPAMLHAKVRQTGMAAVSRTCAFCLACVSLAFACTCNPAAAAIRLQAF